MKEAGTVGGRDHLRLFCALRLPEHVVEALDDWGSRELAERVVARANLHITLAFLGRRPATDVSVVVDATRAAAAAAHAIVLEPRRYRETRSVGMIELEDESGNAAALADDLFSRLEDTGVYRRERRPWLPHVTVMRFRRPPRLRPTLPPIRPFSPSDAAVYHSLLRSTGAQYDVIESFALGG